MTWSATAGPVGARHFHEAVTLQDGRVLVAGGGLGHTSLETWAPDEGFRVVGALGSRFQHHRLALLQEGRVLVTGGTAARSDTHLAACELWDPRTELVRATLPMTMARSHHVCATLPSGEVFVAGGEGNAYDGWEQSTCETWSPETEQWTLRPPPASVERAAHCRVLRDGRVLVAGGIATFATEIWDPARGAWHRSGDLGNVHHTACLVALHDGGALMIAGSQTLAWEPYDPTEVNPLCERWDPTTEQWSPVTPLTHARDGHCAVVFDDGRVLVAGGVSPEHTGVHDAELFDPRTLSWQSAGSLSGERRYHFTLSVVGGRRALAVGGDFECSRSAEIWNG